MARTVGGQLPLAYAWPLRSSEEGKVSLGGVNRESVNRPLECNAMQFDSIQFNCPR